MTVAADTNTLTVGSLFAGIGGFDLGFERAGFKTAWQVEIDPYCRKVLEKNFPYAERFEDIRECGKHNLAPVDVVCGGFPCQDVSNAGLGVGLAGDRSGLWYEMLRIVRELRPRFVVVENTPGLLVRGASTVIGGLAESGYDAEWRVISAADMGAPHLRERIWIVAHPNSVRDLQSNAESESSDNKERDHSAPEPGWRAISGEVVSGGEAVSYSNSRRRQAWRKRAQEWRVSILDCGSEDVQVRYSHILATEPRVGRVANGIPNRVDRLRALGNAVVPQIPELIARRIKEVMA
jgi:DNA (cytosine-5)-methyltransferase 1